MAFAAERPAFHTNHDPGSYHRVQMASRKHTSTASVRDSDDAYARYLKGMDASMRVKVALTAAHVLSGGRAADMGMGSGGGSAALAGLYPSLEVIGVDLDPKLVERSRKEHVLPNLSFEVGDIATPVLAPGSLDAIFDSSVLHHVTSFNGYDRPAALLALSVQREALREGGVLIVRDFLDPGPGDCELELPTSDGDETGDPETAASAALLERFAGEFRSLSKEPGFPLRRIEGTSARPVKKGQRRYALSLRHAVEFVLRKDYRRDWVAEAQEEYTFATQAELEAHFVGLGLRILVSSPHVGLDDDDLPAVQAFEGSSSVLVVPAFRAPAALASLRALHAFVRERMASEHGLFVESLFELGGRYFPSPGMTPEKVYPFAASVTPSCRGRPLHWVPLADAASAESHLVDGHLRVALGRAAQAFEVGSPHASHQSA